MTALTSVESTGLALAAVATGAVSMPLKLPAPVAGTAEQAEPNGADAVLPEAIGVLAIGLLAMGADAAAEAAVEPDAVELLEELLHAASEVATTTASAAVARGVRIFTGNSLFMYAFVRRRRTKRSSMVRERMPFGLVAASEISVT